MISFTFVFETCSAGARPKRIPVATQTIAKKPNTRASMSNVIQYGRPTFWDSPSNHRMPRYPRPSPAMPLMQGEQHALDEQLPDDPPPARAERDADGDFARPVGRARQQQVGDVGAGDEQHERDRAHQRPEHRLDLRADDEVEERRDLRRDVLVAVLVLIRKLRGDVLHLAAGLLERGAVGQAAVDHEGSPLARQPEYRRPLGHRHPDLALERPFEAVGHHADDRGGNRVDADRFADDRGIGRIARFPDAAADQRNRRRALLVVLGDESLVRAGPSRR